MSETSSVSQSRFPAEWDDNGIFSESYEAAYRTLLGMSTKDKVGQLLMVRCPKTDTASKISAFGYGGLVLFEDDFKNKTKFEVTQMLAAYQKASAIPLLVAVDEEGGGVVRVSSNPLLSPERFRSPRELYLKGGLIAIRADTLAKSNLLLSLGINMNLAPVADVSVNPVNYIYGRTLGRPAQEQADYVDTVIRAMNDSGITASLKHFPGYGSNADTHTGVAVDNRPQTVFLTSDFLPFTAGIKSGAETVMVSHNIVKSFDIKPASLSAEVHRVLRETLGFTGIILTDDLSMSGVRQYSSSGDIAVEAFLAGNDMLILWNGDEGYDALLSAVNSGRIPMEQLDRAVFRILAMKYHKNILKP